MTAPATFAVAIRIAGRTLALVFRPRTLRSPHPVIRLIRIGVI